MANGSLYDRDIHGTVFGSGIGRVRQGLEEISLKAGCIDIRIGENGAAAITGSIPNINMVSGNMPRDFCQMS